MLGKVREFLTETYAPMQVDFQSLFRPSIARSLALQKRLWRRFEELEVRRSGLGSRKE